MPSSWKSTLRQIGAARYHNLHPFHRLLHGGKLDKGQVQAWALNRYYYQSSIPIKDAVVISRFRDRATRVEWRHRIEDHDGDHRQRRRHRALAEADRRARARHRLCRIHRRHFAGDALCGGRLCAFRPRPHAAGGDRFVAHRIVRAEPARGADRRHAGALRFHQSGDHDLLQAPAGTGAARRQFRARLRQTPRGHPGGARRGV